MTILDHAESLVRTVLTVVFVMIVLAALTILTPALATPFAKFWYKLGFEDTVAEALSAIPGSEQACIYDDTRKIFVTSLNQLDVDRMIEQAVHNNLPLPRTNPFFRDPHFRVLANGKTYYWSFRNREFYPFRSDRLTLEGHGVRKCEAFRLSPQAFRQDYRDREGLEVTEANYCCGL